MDTREFIKLLKIGFTISFYVIYFIVVNFTSKLSTLLYNLKRNPFNIIEKTYALFCTKIKYLVNLKRTSKLTLVILNKMHSSNLATHQHTGKYFLNVLRNRNLLERTLHEILAYDLHRWAMKQQGLIDACCAQISRNDSFSPSIVPVLHCNLIDHSSCIVPYPSSHDLDYLKLRQVTIPNTETRVDPFLYTNDSGPTLQKTMTSKLLSSYKDSRFTYFVSNLQDKKLLVHTSVQSAILIRSNFLMIFNSYAIGINDEILSTAYSILSTSDSPNFIVLGLTNSFVDAQEISHLNGLFLIGFRCNDQLMLHEKAFFENLDWFNPGSASRLISNLRAECPDWPIYQLKKVLPQPMSIEDIPSLAQKIGIPLRHLAQDSLSVILACDANQSIELLVDCLDIAISNCSQERLIQFLIVKQTTSGPITLELLRHRLKSSKDNVDFDVIETDIINRGEVIRLAIESKASGSALLIADATCQLPSNWDCAIFECLRRPGSGVGFFSTRINLSDNLINSKDIKSAFKCYLFTAMINIISNTIGLPIANAPVFCYTHHLRVTGGYPRSDRITHLVDLVSKLRIRIGRPISTRFTKASFGILDFNLFNSDLASTALYAVLVSSNWITGINSSQAKCIISKINA